MAKLPGHMRLSRLERNDGKLVATVHFNLWHPGFWWLVIKALFSRKANKGNDG